MRYWYIRESKDVASHSGLQPLMMFPVPSLGKKSRDVSDIFVVTLSALSEGILTTIVLYFMDKLRQKSKIPDKFQKNPFYDITCHIYHLIIQSY
jgi:hypothetical protein